MSDSRQDYAHLKDVLNKISDLPAADREPRAREILHAEPALLKRVLIMLEEDQINASFLEAGLPEMITIEDESVTKASRQKETNQRPEGSRIGPFTLHKVLGEGGMGVVYLAYQQEPVKREVALKLISVHATTAQRIRFDRECRMLARFSHPNVTTMLQNGVTESGEPYVAMEYVDGLPISKWCTNERTTIEQRIKLFIGACMGVAHAHEKGILHRDIKPSNILVTRIDGKATAKVIDFGIATAFDHAENDDEVTLTRQQLLGTLAYLSPESVYAKDRESLDARSDVYSLGVILFELMTGQKTYDTGNLTMVEWVKHLSTASSPSASKTFSDQATAQRLKFATETGSSPTAIDRILHSDLGAILHKALALDPKRRYATSRELAEDLKRHLSGEAVLAHPPSRWYIAEKFIRRNWISMSALTLLILILTGGIIARSLEVKKTRLAMAESTAISGFLVNLFEHASPLRTDKDDVTLQDIIDTGSLELKDRFNDQPLIRANLLHTLGKVYSELGQHQKGIEMMQQAIDLMDQQTNANTLVLARLLSDNGTALRHQMRTDEAETTLLRAINLAEGHIDTEPLLLADVANSLGNIYQVNSQFEQALEYHQLTLKLRTENLPEDDVQIASANNNIAADLINFWQTTKALPYAKKALQGYESALPAGHPWTAVARNNLAVILGREGRKKEAFKVLNEALDEASHRLGAEHPDVADIWYNIAVNLFDLGRQEECFAAAQKYLDLMQKAFGSDSTRTLLAQRRLINLHRFERNDEVTLAAFEENLERQRRVSGEKSLRTLIARAYVAQTLLELKEYTRADAILADSMQLLLETVGPTNYQTFMARLLQAISIGRQGHAEAAIGRLETLFTDASTSLSTHSMLLGQIQEELSRQNMQYGDWEQAVKSAQKAQEIWAASHNTFHIAHVQFLLSKAYIGTGDEQLAYSYLIKAVTTYQKLLPATNTIRIDSESLLSQLERNMSAK